MMSKILQKIIPRYLPDFKDDFFEDELYNCTKLHNKRISPEYHMNPT